MRPGPDLAHKSIHALLVRTSICGTYACVDVFFMCTHKRAEEIQRGREPGQFKIGKNNVEPRFHYPPGYCTHTVDSLFIE